MRAGNLRHVVNVVPLVETQSTLTGELVKSWSTTVTPMWADIAPLKGNELFQSKQIQSKVDTKITMRYTTAVSAKGKITHGSDDYIIENYINISERNIELQVMCYKVLI